MTEALIFFGVSPTGNSTICKSDGTLAGTGPIIDTELGVNIGGELDMPGPVLLDYGNAILARGMNNGEDVLWFYNKGAHTYTPFDFEPTNTGTTFNPQGFVLYKGLIYFNGYVFGQAAPDLFVTDGNAGGTQQITTSSLNPSSLAVAYNKLFFSGNSASGPILYSYDGSSSQPAPVGVNVANPSSLTVAFVGTSFVLPDPDLPFFHPPQPPLFMSGQDSSGTWLFKYDDSSLTKIAPTTAPSSGLAPYNLVNLGWVQTRRVGPFNLESWHRALCFLGSSASGGQEVWISLGTSDSTNQIPMPFVSNQYHPFNLTPFNGMLYFTAYDSAPPAPEGGRGLFVYDPVANHTRQIIMSSAYNLDPGNFQPGWFAMSQYTMAVFNNKLYFNATKKNDISPILWCIDGAPTSGQATPQAVGGRQPFSLTTANPAP